MKQHSKIAYTFVIADLFHFGHLQILRTAKENADYHICGLVSDEAAHLWQGNNISNYDERKAVLESLDCVDEIMKQESMDPTDNIRRIKEKNPDAEIIIVHGDDWKTMPGIEYIESIGGRIIQPEYYARLSRDAIIKKFKQTTADHPLKHEYFTHHFRIGDIVQFNAQSVNRLVSTKANTLKNFQPILKSCSIEKLFICTVNDFQEFREKVVESLQKQFSGKKLVIRSSSVSEDRYNTSNAGRFESVADIDPDSRQDLLSGIQKVIDSYKKGLVVNLDDQILVQSQTKDIKKSGVVFTRNLQKNTPYYVINYDDTTGKTDTVTGGEAGKSVWLYRNTRFSDYPSEWRNLLTSVQEIETFLPGMVLDIEFAEKFDGTIVIFQIRPLAANIKHSEFDNEKFNSIIKSLVRRYKHRPFLSDMAFWNPAEIIGDNPHPLDYSLYREIITKKAWNTGLVSIGYTPVDHELMERYGNKPYINLEYVFRSLTPRSIGKKLQDKLVDYYRSKLRKDLSAHDKVEFEIIFNCYDFTSPQKLDELKTSGFTGKEIKEVTRALQDMTVSIIKGYKKKLKLIQKDVRSLLSKTDAIFKKSRQCTDPFVCIDYFLELLKYISVYGTPQFSTIAREAFIAKSIFKSLAESGLIPHDDIEGFLEGISSIASDFDRDFRRFSRGDMSKDRFLKIYGHLRAGTYDITSPRYDSVQFNGLNQKRLSHTCPAEEKNRIKLDTNKIKKILKDSVFSTIAAGDFMFFLKSSIEQREYLKFQFTKPLSLAIELLARAGELLGFSRSELAYLDIQKIKSARFYDNTDELADFWRLSIEPMKALYDEYSKLVLPPVLQSEKDFVVVRTLVSRPNFITSKTAEGAVVNLDTEQTVDITGKIVLITKADPGFDWIFTRHIKGLITKYGGVASHMAIRCAEFNIPAAIGCGGQIFNSISARKGLKLDCGNKQIIPGTYA